MFYWTKYPSNPFKFSYFIPKLFSLNPNPNPNHNHSQHNHHFPLLLSSASQILPLAEIEPSSTTYDWSRQLAGCSPSWCSPPSSFFLISRRRSSEPRPRSLGRHPRRDCRSHLVAPFAGLSGPSSSLARSRETELWLTIFGSFRSDCFGPFLKLYRHLWDCLFQQLIVW